MDATVEVIPQQSMAGQLIKAEIDQQITTAKEYPRSVTKFHAQAKSLATLSRQVAETCQYAVKRGGTLIKGPSARMAEILAHSWGNCRVGARIVEEGDKFVTAQGVFHDLETNTAITREVRRRITNKDGVRYNDDMITMTCNAASSIAMRNAILAGIPKAIWDDIMDQVRDVIKGDEKDLATRRESAFQYLNKMGAKDEAILAALDVTGMADIGLDHIDTLLGMVSAIKSGEATIADSFPTASARKSKIDEMNAQHRTGPNGTGKKASATAGAEPPDNPSTGAGPARTPDTSAITDDDIPA